MAERVSNAEIKELLEQIIRHSGGPDALGELRQIQSVQAEQIKQLMAITDKISATMYGNGKTGLITIVSNLEKEMAKGQLIKNTVITVVISLTVSTLFYLVLLNGPALAK